MTRFRSIYSYNKDFIKERNEDYWYIAGIFAADGYINKETIELALNKKDIRIIKKIRDIICPDKPIYIKNSVDARVLKLNNSIMSKHFMDLFSMTTSKKHKEIEFPEVPDEYLKDFIRGYVDGDGTIDSTKAYQTVNGEKRIYVGPRLRILGNEKFLRSMVNKIKKHIPNKTNAVNKKGKENVYLVTYNFSTAKNILQWLYNTKSDLMLERKRDRFLEVCNLKLEDIV